MEKKTSLGVLGSFVVSGVVVLGAPTASILSLNTLGLTSLPVNIAVIGSFAWLMMFPLFYISWIKRL